ncbi:MAG: c-type cytochrome [Gammaproteobacteria bacterium]|nr:c-type cytochrome [Gammaproteobacteria bacterium]
MPTIVKVLAFSLGMALIFTGIANLLPQVEGQAPEDKEVDLGALTMDSFIALGEDIFKNKGTCTLCHNNMGRAPDILHLDMNEVSRKHLADERYKGSATDVAGYIHESMVDPGAYVVKGFGKKGSKDTESPMPAVNKAPIELTDVEMDAVTAFLQAKDGGEVTVALPSEAPAPSTKEAVPSVAATAEEAIGKFGCSACHAVLDSSAELGPSLKNIGARLSAAQIRQSIVDPNAVIAEGYPPIMPADFADRMMAKELEMMVKFLANSK